MPKSPIYGPIFYDKGEIYPQNETATAIKTAYKHRNPPIRLKDVCQMRKLGDRAFRPESEWESCNYLWSVTLKAGTDPYESVIRKKELPYNKNKYRCRWNRQVGVFEKMRNSFRHYREQLTTIKQHNTDEVKWLVKPRQLKNVSSHEGAVWPHHRWCKGNRCSSVQSAPPAHDTGMRCLAKAEFSKRREKLTLSAHFEEALRKCKKNMENEQKKRKDGERNTGGEASTNTAGVARKTVIVKRQLADTTIKRARLEQPQEMKKDEAHKGNEEQALKYIRFNVDAKENGNSPQHQATHCTCLAPVTPSAPPLELSTNSSQNSQLPALDINDCAQQLSEISTLSTRKSSFTRIESAKLNTSLGKTLCKGLANTCISLQQRLTQAFPKPKAAYETFNADTKDMPRTSKNGQEQALKVNRKKTYRHYRTFRRRGKRSSKPQQDKPSPHIDKQTQCSNESASSSSASSASLSERHREMENGLKSKKEQFKRDYDIVKKLPAIERQSSHVAATLTAQICDATKVEPVSSDFTISFHKPITLRDLIQRKPRAKRTKVAQPAKRVEQNVRLGSTNSPEPQKLLKMSLK
uniref:Uncharacterized protein n=1 Tax=Ceratitis capitata TaxID=7213 RepID=W8BJG5_CERCA